MPRRMALPAGLRSTDLLGDAAGGGADRPASLRHEERQRVMMPKLRKAYRPTAQRAQRRAPQAGTRRRAHLWKACRRAAL